ncbi:MAG: hypothetical protein M1824_003839 [Vezdaea acicularis]|nr:MAG: hypothetical protein M1824_003839 [Vezdaea acicularis]
MSTTLTETTVPISTTDGSSSISCPNCGADISSSPHAQFAAADAAAAKQRIAELESQVKILTGKATAAVDKLADYEDHVNRRQFAPAKPATPPPPPTHAINSNGVTARISTLLSPRTPPPSQAPFAKPPQTDLATALAREQTLRLTAESQLAASSNELEELSAQLFQQANEMVAQERRARAKLEARVEVLEQRDKEKRNRLERLEEAVRRVERVRGLLERRQ